MNGKTYLDKHGVYEELNRLGFNVSARQVFRMFVDRDLPVFMWRGKLVIERGVLHKHFEDLQRNAISGRKAK